MNESTKIETYATHLAKRELMKSRLEVFTNESGNLHSSSSQSFDDRRVPVANRAEGVDFIIKTSPIGIGPGNYHDSSSLRFDEQRLSLHPVNLEQDRGVKIPKKLWKHELRDNLWIMLVLYMKEMEPAIYLIPSKVFEKPDNYIFIDNDQGARFSHMSNWEIKIFTKAIPELSKYALSEMIKNLQK